MAALHVPLFSWPYPDQRKLVAQDARSRERSPRTDQGALAAAAPFDPELEWTPAYWNTAQAHDLAVQDTARRCPAPFQQRRGMRQVKISARCG